MINRREFERCMNIVIGCVMGSFLESKEKHKIVEKLREIDLKVIECIQYKELDEWSEDDGSCLWWKLPVEEEPYVGSPLHCDFPDYVTHFTKYLMSDKADIEDEDY